MVTSATSFSGNGLRDWLLQRVSAVILAVYTLFLLGYLLTQPDVSYQQWLGLFSHPCMQIATVLTLLAVLIHGWIGVWTVTTDYLKSTRVRVLVQLLVAITLLSLFIWGVQILWGINS